MTDPRRITDHDITEMLQRQARIEPVTGLESRIVAAVRTQAQDTRSIGRWTVRSRRTGYAVARAPLGPFADGAPGARRAHGVRQAALLAALLVLAMIAALAFVIGQHRTDVQRLLGAGEIILDTRAFDPDTGTVLDRPCPDCGPIRYPSWSADGKRLAYLGGEGIAILDTRDGSIEQLGACRTCGSDQTDLRSYISLSADGAQVAYAEDGQIKVVDVSTKGVRQLTHLPPGQVANGPALSPDGQQVAFAITDQPGLWLVGIDGGAVRRFLADDQALDPAWSPDGSTIAYDREALGPTYQVWLYDVASGTRRMVWEAPGCCISDLAGPGWSPDGSSIALVASDPTHSFALWVVDVASGRPRHLVMATTVSRPAWRPVAAGPPIASSGEATASPTDPAAACGSVSMHPLTSTVLGGPWDTTGLADGIAVGVPQQADDPTNVLYVATGGMPDVGEVGVEAAGDVLVAIRPLAATRDTSAVVQLDATSQRRPLSDCSDLWRISVSDGAPVATRLTSHTGGQRITWSSVSPTGRRIAFALDDSSGDGSVEGLTVLDLDHPTRARSLGDPPCGTDRVAVRLAAWSSDEDQIAVTCTGRVELIDLATGDRGYLTIPAATTVSSLSWRAADGAAPATLLATVTTDGVNGPLTLLGIDTVTGTTTSLGTWGSSDGTSLAWLGGWTDLFSPDQRWLWSLGAATGSTDPGGYVIDLATGDVRLLIPPDEHPDPAYWAGADALVTSTTDDEVTMGLIAHDPRSGSATAIATLPAGTWVTWVP